MKTNILVLFVAAAIILGGSNLMGQEKLEKKGERKEKVGKVLEKKREEKRN